MRLSLLLSSLVLALAGCGPEATPPSATPATSDATPAVATPGERLAASYSAFWEEWLTLNPLQATQIGDPRYNDRLPNTLSPAYREQEREFHQRHLDAVRALGSAGLDAQDLLSYEMFVRDRAYDLEELAFPAQLLPINQFYNLANLIAMQGAGTNAQPFKTVADYDAWLARAGQVPVLFDQAITNMREGMAQGIVQPKVLMEKVLPQLDQHIVAKPEDSILWGPIRKLPEGFSEADRTRMTAAYSALITDTLVPAYTKLRAFIADEYLPAARDTVGLGALPGGPEWYAYLVRARTTTELTPEEIHAIGLSEIERIHGEMRKLMARTGFEGELQDFFKAMKADPKQYFASREELLASYQGVRATVEPLLPKLFAIEPRADFEIRLVEPFREASSSSGSYQGPPQDGSRPGIFYVNAYDLKARPRYAMESLYLHEATPGHHFQIALQRELTELPAFRRFGGETAYNEGWGLYAESLGLELGVYTDPAMYFGALSAELWRSIRLVADTGLHAKGWTRQQVLDFMYANSAVEPAVAISEAERFMAIPGQALAYKIGEMRIRALRTRAEQALGERFDLRAFHTEVLKDGSLPLGILDAKVERWIAAQAG
jgi:uncharacterized protein (DUF885 family)